MRKGIVGLFIILLLLGGGFILRSKSGGKEKAAGEKPTPAKALEPIGGDVKVEFTPNKGRTKATLTISNLTEAGVISLEYEILYEAEGLIKGVNSGSAPIKVPASGVVKREIDFGTCSSGVCRYDKNVGTITLVIRFNTSSGPKIFKKEYP